MRQQLVVPIKSPTAWVWPCTLFCGPGPRILHGRSAALKAGIFIALSLTLSAGPLAAEQVELIVREGEPTEAEALDVSLVVFHPGYEGDSDEARRQGIFAEIRDIEIKYLPYALRRTLVDSNQWGAVRVVPQVAVGAELLITGRIVQSNGASLELQLQARDSRGAVWMERTYGATATQASYAASEQRGQRPFQDIYSEAANALLAARNRLEQRELVRIREVALLRYADSLAPDTFGDFLERDGDSGLYRALRLPSQEDPMMARIQRIRAQEYLFIDTTDEQYATLYTEITPIYDLWRAFYREQVLYQEAYDQRLEGRSRPPKGSYMALWQTYNGFRWAKLQEQETKLLAEGFNNEVAPTNIDVEGKVFKLGGSLDDRHREWRRILRQIYDLERVRQAP